MAKNLRIAIPMLLVLGVGGVVYQMKGSGEGESLDSSALAADLRRRDAGVPRDGGIRAEAGVPIGPDSGMGGAPVPDGGASGKGDAGGPTIIWPCGNCSYDPVSGLLKVQAMQRMPSEEPLTWTVVGVEVVYQNGTFANPLAKQDGQSLTLAANEVNCSASKNFNLNPAQSANIKAINLRLRSSGGVTFKRGCVKLSANGQITPLETNCNCCGCALCLDVGSCSQ